MIAIQQAKRNIRRTPFQAVAACMTMFMTFFALLVFLVLAAGSEALLKFYESKPQVIAFFGDTATEEDITALQKALAQDERITKVKYVSQEEAFQVYKDNNKDDPTLLEYVTPNMLPPSLEISTRSPDDLKPIAQTLHNEPAISDILLPEDVVEKLTTFTKVARLVGTIVVGYLVLFSLLIILLIIGFKIRTKRDEIEIMRLIGASSSFIRNPFILEGIFYGVTGAFSAWVAVYITLWYITPFVQSYITEVKILPPDPLFMLALLSLSLVGAVIIGALSSFSAVRRYLHI